MVGIKGLFLVVLLGITAGMSGCGFQLRTQLPSHTKKIAAPLQIYIAQGDKTLGEALSHQLYQLGYVPTLAPQNTQNLDIAIHNIQLKSYRLVGVLTEIRTMLSASVHYRLPDGTTHTAPLVVERSYQYNQNDVGSSDKQAGQVQIWLYESLASRISEQYHALSQ